MSGILMISLKTNGDEHRESMSAGDNELQRLKMKVIISEMDIYEYNDRHNRKKLDQDTSYISRSISISQPGHGGDPRSESCWRGNQEDRELLYLNVISASLVSDSNTDTITAGHGYHLIQKPTSSTLSSSPSPPNLASQTLPNRNTNRPKLTPHIRRPRPQLIHRRHILALLYFVDRDLRIRVSGMECTDSNCERCEFFY
jgi:hypothetical protein